MPLEANASLLLHIMLALKRKTTTKHSVHCWGESPQIFLIRAGSAVFHLPSCLSVHPCRLAPSVQVFPVWKAWLKKKKKDFRIPQLSAGKDKPSEVDLNLPAYPQLRCCLRFPADQKRWIFIEVDKKKKRKTHFNRKRIFHRNEHPHKQPCQLIRVFPPPKFFH